MDENILNLVVAVVVAVASVVALRFAERAISVRMGPTLQSIPDNIQSLIDKVSSDMQERHRAEIAELRSHYETQLAHSDRKIQELEGRVNWLFAQLVAAGGKVPEPMPVGIPSLPVPVPVPVTVLGIWPASNLSIRAEIDAIFKSGVRYTVIDSDVTKRRVLTEVDRTRPAILHVGAHATALAVLLDDGEAPVGWWKHLAQRYPFRLAVLNACESLDIVDAMQDAGVTAVVGMRKEIGDSVAVLFASEFYNWLMRGRTVEEAVSLAKLALDYVDAEMIGVRDKSGWTVNKG